MADPQEQSRSWMNSLLWGFGLFTLFGVANVRTPEKTAPAAEPVRIVTAAPAPAAAAPPAPGTAPAANPCPLPPPLLAWATALGECPAAPGKAKAGPVPRVIVATIPDPDTLSYGNYAVQAMESILRAAATAEYSFDRHWLPWTAETAAAARSQFAPKQEEPGVMIFRGGPSWLVVFLVGETPTGGIHRNVFHKAAEYAARLNPGEGLRVLGPTYSGSAPSLAQALGTRNYCADVVTGSATGLSVANLFRQEGHTFRATVENDAEVLTRFTEFYVARHGWRERVGPKPRMAYLLETGTDYAKLDEKGNGDRNYYFPMQIARMRAAYQNDPVLREQGRQPLRNRTGLDLRFDETTSGFDKFPDYAPDSTALSQEHVLERLTNQLLDHQPDFVSIFASDIRDVLFLSSFLRRRLPAFPLVLVDADVLYGNESERYSLNGALSLATYPLALETQDWSKLPGRRQFPSQVAQGIYNATLLHLSGGQKHLLDMNQVTGLKPGTMPVWLTMFASGANWPVAALPKPAESQAWLSPAGEVTPRYGRLHLDFGFFLTLLTVLPALLMTASTPWFRRLPIPPEARAWLEEFDYRKLMSEPVAAGVLLMSVAAVQALVTGVLWRYTETMWGEREFSAAALPLLLLAQVNILAAAVLWMRCVPAHWAAGGGVARGAIVLISAGAIYATYSLAALPLTFEPENLSGFFFVYRSMHLNSGASPLVPMALLLLVVGLTTWSHLRNNGIWLTHLPDFGSCTGALAQAATILRDANGGGTWPMWGGLVWILLSVVGIQIWELWTIESRSYNVAFGIIMGGAYWSMSYLFLRLLRTGHQVRRAAAELEEAGYGEEFNGLQALRPWGLWEGHSWRATRAARAKQLAVLGLSAELAGPEAKRMVDERVTPETAAMPLQFALAIQLVLRVLRRQLVFLGAGIVCTLIAFKSYPFEPRQWISGYVALTSLGMSIVVFLTLMRVEHDPLLARLFGSAGKGLDMQFYLRTGGALLVPLITVISSLFPDIGQELSRWLMPWLQAGRQ